MRRSGLWLLTLVGCYNPTIASNTPCDTTDQCPGDLMCIDHRCGGTLSPDAGGTDAPDVDARPIDDALVVEHIVISDPAQMHDAEIWGANPNINYGTDILASIDDSESGLYSFDLTSIPSTKHVLSATLTLTVTDYASTDGGTVTLHRVRERWVETEATWIARTASRSWSVSGARSPASDATQVAAFTPAELNTPYEITLPAQLIEDWISDPSHNFGFVIVRGTSTMHVHLGTRESATPPTLAIDVY